MKKTALLIIFLQVVYQFTHARLITYPAPQGISLSTDYTVSVRQQGHAWQPVAVYPAKVDHVIKWNNNNRYDARQARIL